MQNKLEYEFFMSQIRWIQDIKENEKIKISLVFYEPIQGPCVLKVCKNRDLSVVCEQLKEIRHSNVAVVYDYVYAEPDTYIVEEHIAGITVEELLEEKRNLSEKETVKIIMDICKGLKVLHCHRPPVVHNDINTSNIMIREDGNVKLFDFDISRIFKAGANKNTRLFGTEEYAAPEHFGYGQSEPCTDIYSLGVTMHEMLTGCPLTNEHKVTYKGSLKKIIRKCVEIDPKKRYASARQLEKVLKQYQNRWLSCLRVAALLSVMFFMAVLMASIKGNELEQLNSVTDSYMKENEPEQLNFADASYAVTVSESVGESQKKEQEESVQKYVEEEKTEKIPELKMETVYEVQGTLYSMLALNDGTFVTLEYESGSFWIKTSTGITKELSEISGWYGAKLAYDTYSDRLYVLDFSNSDLKIYRIQEDFTLSMATVIDEKFSYDISHLPCNFFSDGKMIINQIFGLVDTESWLSQGGAPGGVYVINDRMYQRNGSVFFKEVDMEGHSLAEYDLSEIFANPFDNEIYIDGKFAYFIGSNMDSDENIYYYIYRFDGDNYEEVVCLNTYKYYSFFQTDHLCVTDQAIRCYDIESKVIKEFQLN